MEPDYLKANGMHDDAKPEIFRFARELRLKMTETEKMVWDVLKTKPEGLKFRRQHPIGRYILDYYCHSKRLSIEMDGGYHGNTEQKAKDAIRTEYLQKVGIKEMRFLNSEVIDDLDFVIERIMIELRAPTPGP